MTWVRKSKRAQFSERTNPVTKSATIGAPLRLDCEPSGQSVPTPRVVDFEWTDGTRSWPLTRRVQIDDSGTLSDNI